MIVIIDYGMGNLRSVIKAFERLHTDVKISSDLGQIKNAAKLVLPGVGHFQNGMSKLNELNLIETLNSQVMDQKVPILGICLGMQLFAKNSEEGDVKGLGWLDMNVIKFRIENKNKWKVPHMGWNSVMSVKESKLFDNIEYNSNFYFVHSYHVVLNNPEGILATTIYEKNFVCAIESQNIYGVQFHPEKSHSDGLRLLSNFINISTCFVPDLFQYYF